jgi:hypothetical protein
MRCRFQISTTIIQLPDLSEPASQSRLELCILKKAFLELLEDNSLFKQAYVAFDTVCWLGNIDIAPETLYDTASLVHLEVSVGIITIPNSGTAYPI